MNRKWSLLLVVTFILGFAIQAYIDGKKTSGIQPNQPIQRLNSMLTGENNQTVDIFDVNDDRTRIVYFGFTRCPDVCPTSLAMLAGALNQISEEQQKSFRPIFISLDPERDNAETSAQYAHYFHPMIEGLSAPLDITTPLAHKYGVLFRKTTLENSELKYTLDHSSYFYFLKPDGTLITKVPHTLTPAPIVDAISKLTAKGKPNES